MLAKTKRRISLAWQVLLRGDKLHDPKEDIPSLTPEEILEVKTFFPMTKFFIFGHARSGTTLFARLVRLHPEVHCNWQGHFFTRKPLLQGLVKDEEVRIWLSRRSNRWNRGQDLSPIVLRAACDFILERDARREGKVIVGDKSPNNLLNGEAVRLLQNIYPDARLIFLVRDGRDAALSHRMQTFIDKPQHLTKEDEHILKFFMQDAKPFLHRERSLFTHSGISKAASAWVENVVETESKGVQLFGDGFTAVKFEELLNDPWDELSRIWKYLGADPDIPGLSDAVDLELRQNPDATWQQEKAREISILLRKGEPGFWREMFTERDTQVFEKIAGDTLKKWGYEVNSLQ